MSKIGTFASRCADLLGVGAFIGLLILVFCDFEVPEGLNIHSFLVGILSAIITLLVAWNIYSTIDAKEIRSKLRKELNYAHNKMDDNKADTYGFICQMAYAQLSHDKEYTIKLLCLRHGIMAVKIYSSIPGDESKGESVVSTLIDMLDYTRNIKLDKDDVIEFLCECKEVKNSAKFIRFPELIGKIKESS